MMASGDTSSSQNTDQTREVDPNRLIERDGCLGFEKSSGFETVTNFIVSVGGYVVDVTDDVPMGYILMVEMEAFGEQPAHNNLRTFFVTNKTLGSQQAIINALDCNSLWIAQTKEPFLPQYIYRLCRNYMKQDHAERKKFQPVKVIGKQPGADTWVFNKTVQMDQYGQIIPVPEREYILECKKHDFLVNVAQDLDNGEALAELFRAEKELFVNNFPQVLMAHAVSSLAANFDLAIDIFDGCSIPVLIGHPVSGKSTALKAVLSVFGDATLLNCVTRKYIESRQSKTTIPFGWDDVSDTKMLGEVAVSSFNQAGSATMRGESKPHTVPIVTTNLDSGHLKVKSRWFRIQFEELNPKFKGQERCIKEDKLKKAMKNANKSIYLVTAYIHGCLSNRSTTQEFEQVESLVEAACTAPDLVEVDHRAQRQFSVMLYCCKKILEAVHMEEEFEAVCDKLKMVILPSYVKTCTSSNLTAMSSHSSNYGKIEALLKEFMPKALLSGSKDNILKFFDQDFLPQKCNCGEAVTFHVSSLIDYLKSKGGEDATGITDHSLRFFIKQHDIGCVGRQVLFRNQPTQVSAAHIRREWFNDDDIHALDEWLGKRNKKGHGKSKGVKKPGQGKGTAGATNGAQVSRVINEQEPESEEPSVVKVVINEEEPGNEAAGDVYVVINEEEPVNEGPSDVYGINEQEPGNEEASDVYVINEQEPGNEEASDVSAVVNEHEEPEKEGASGVKVVINEEQPGNEAAGDVYVINEQETEKEGASGVKAIINEQETEKEGASGVYGVTESSNVSKRNTTKVGRKRGIEKLQDAWNDGQSVEGKRTRAKTSRQGTNPM